MLNLLSQLRTEQIKLSDQFQRHVPLVVKVSPDETDETLKTNDRSYFASWN